MLRLDTDRVPRNHNDLAFAARRRTKFKVWTQEQTDAYRHLKEFNGWVLRRKGDPPSSHCIDQCIVQCIDQSIDQSIDQCIDQSIDQCIDGRGMRSTG